MGGGIGPINQDGGGRTWERGWVEKNQKKKRGRGS